MSYYNLGMVVTIFILVIATIVMTYLKRDFTKKIVKREDVLLGSILLLAIGEGQFPDFLCSSAGRILWSVVYVLFHDPQANVI